MAAKIWVVGAGKGGVGKTFIATSVGISLAKLNYSVLLIDFDLAGANVHTNLGLFPSKTTIQQFLSGESPLANLVQPTPVPRLSYIQGVWTEWEHTNCSAELGRSMIEDARKLPYDIVVIDLGPSAVPINLELFKHADEKILVTSAEPTAIEKTYRFIESMIVHRLCDYATGDAYTSLRASLKAYRAENKKGHFSFRKYLYDHSGFSFDNFDSLTTNPTHLIINCVRSHHDSDLGYAIKSVCNKYFDLPLDYIGAVGYDNAVWQSIRSREIFLISKPFTALSGQFLSICKAISQSEATPVSLKAVV